MTAQEAKIQIESIPSKIWEQLSPSDNEAMEMAIKALEKQIAKRPDYEGYGYDEDGDLIYDYAKCPICGHDFEYGINDWECNYCSDCGQKLDWGE